MNQRKTEKPSLFAKRELPKAIPLNFQTELTNNSVFDEKKNFPFIFEARTKIEPFHWITKNQILIEKLLLQHGAVLLRGFEVKDAEKFGLVVEKFGNVLPYKERSSPRTLVSGNVYTSTEYPASQEIFFHNENSYAHLFPKKLFFYCQKQPADGGATPLSDVSRVFQVLPSEILEKFQKKGVLYIRNFGHGIGLTWQEVFQTESRVEVEKMCQESGYQTEWLGEERLRTRRIGQAVFEHPLKKIQVWFNHAVFFHVTTHSPQIRDNLLSQFAAEDLPHNTFYGDGEEIETEVLEILRRSYRESAVSFPWKEQDILIIDNILLAHAREPFEGERKILVAMTD